MKGNLMSAQLARGVPCVWTATALRMVGELETVQDVCLARMLEERRQTLRLTAKHTSRTPGLTGRRKRDERKAMVVL